MSKIHITRCDVCGSKVGPFTSWIHVDAQLNDGRKVQFVYQLQNAYLEFPDLAKKITRREEIEKPDVCPACTLKLIRKQVEQCHARLGPHGDVC